LQEKCEKLRQVLKEERNVAIVTHSNADVDAIASLCLAGYLARSVGIQYPWLMVPEGIALEARKAVDLCKSLDLEIKIVKRGADLAKLGVPERFDVCIVVDTASYVQLKSLKDIVSTCSRKVVVDHHAERDIDADIEFIDPSRLSSSELMYEITELLGISIPKTLLDLVLAGIISDSKRFLRANPRSFMVVAKLLLNGASYENALSLTQPPQRPPHYRLAKIKCVLRHRGFKISSEQGDLYLALSEVGAYESDCASSLLALGYDIALVLSEDDALRATRIVYRAKEDALGKMGIDIYSDILRKLVETFGGGGGGHKSAGAAIVMCRDSDSVARKLIEILVSIFRNRLSELVEQKVGA